MARSIPRRKSPIQRKTPDTKPVEIKKSTPKEKIVEEEKIIETPKVKEKEIPKEEVVEPQKAPIEIEKVTPAIEITPDPEKSISKEKESEIPQYGEITEYTKKDIYQLICRLKGLNLSSRNPIIKVFEKNTATLKSLAAIKQKDINEQTIDVVFHMYRNICTNKETFKTDNKEKILIKDIAPMLTDIVEYAFKFIENSYERRQVMDKDYDNRTYRDAIESIHDRTI